jgi:hypothetical protein
MSWNLVGKRVTGMYLGLFPYCGRVTESRVKYGGTVQHTVLLDDEIKVYGEVREVVLVGNDSINRIHDERDIAY